MRQLKGGTMALQDDVEKLKEHWTWLKQGGVGLSAELRAHETSTQLEARHVADYLDKLEAYIEELTGVVERIAVAIDEREGPPR